MVRYTRKAILFAVDAILLNIATYASLLAILEGYVPAHFKGVFLRTFLILTLIKTTVYNLFGLYRSLWQYASVREFIQIFLGTLVGEAAAYIFGMLTDMMYPEWVYLVSWLLTFLLLSAARSSYRLLRLQKNMNIRNQIKDLRRAMIIGAGDAGAMVIKEMQNHAELGVEPVVVIDDNKWKHGTSIYGVPVKGDRYQIEELAEKYRIDEIIVAIPSANKKEISEILKICKKTKCKLKTLPGVYEIINGKVNVRDIRDVSIEDLLGRDEVKLDIEKIAGYLKGETVLVTGGGGSIGSELCRQIAKYNPKKLIIFDIYENNAYDLQNELMYTYKGLNLEVLIGSVRDVDRLKQVFSEHKPGVVFHAAAHKHVPLMEANPAEAIKNNVFGTLNTAQCAHEYGVKRFVLISTDKAVNPTNVMGASKRLAEMIIQSLNNCSKTEFAVVRFGNVLGSNGSVIPLFKKQIAQGGPVTITHPDIIRYFMTIPEAASLVIQAGAMAKGGEIFILDMGQPVKIVDLARDLIRLSGLEPDVDIKLEFTGLRPGEKLYEELLLAEEDVRATVQEKIYVGTPLDMSYNEVLMRIKALENCLDDPDRLRECLSRVVPTYTCNYKEVLASGK